MTRDGLVDRVEPEATAAAREWFARAIALDAEFAAPHGGLAQAIMRQPGRFLGMPFDEYARSRAPWMDDACYAHLMQGLRLAGWAG